MITVLSNDCRSGRDAPKTGTLAFRDLWRGCFPRFRYYGFLALVKAVRLTVRNPCAFPRHRALSCPRDGRHAVPGVRRGAAEPTALCDGRRARRIPGGGHPAAGQRLGFLALLPGAV